LLGTIKIKRGDAVKTSLFILLLFFTLNAKSELLVNSDFDVEWDHVDSTGYIYEADIDNSNLGWDFSELTGLSMSGTAWHGTAVDGGQYAFIQRGTKSDPSSISQTFTLLDEAFLSLDFLWSSRPKYPTLQNLLVTIDTGDYYYVITDFLADTNEWSSESFELGNLSAGTYTLNFYGYRSEDLVDDIDLAVFIDNVSLTAEETRVDFASMSNIYSVSSPFHISCFLMGGLLMRYRKRKT
tara:strand:+ start:5269 stop:5985 length:717 start_codon:yes stop_codon:yes gene_type:complete